MSVDSPVFRRSTSAAGSGRVVVEDEIVDPLGEVVCGRATLRPSAPKGSNVLLDGG